MANPSTLNSVTVNVPVLGWKVNFEELRLTAVIVVSEVAVVNVTKCVAESVVLSVRLTLLVAQLSVPLAFVTRACPALPSVAGSVQVTFEDTVDGA